MIYFSSDVYHMVDPVRVARWGNSLGIRLPKAVVDVLELRDGDEIEIRVADSRTFEVARPASRAELLTRLRELRGSIPADFIFDRSEANDRG